MSVGRTLGRLRGARPRAGPKGSDALGVIQRRIGGEAAGRMERVRDDLAKREKVDRVAAVIESSLDDSELTLLAAELQVRVPKSQEVSSKNLAKALAKCWIGLKRKEKEREDAERRNGETQAGEGDPQVQTGTDEAEAFDSEAFFESLSLDEKLDSLVETSVRSDWSGDSPGSSAERALLVGVETFQSRRKGGYGVEESLDELERLAESSGLRAVARVQQRLTSPDRTFYIGEGKLEEVVRLARQFEVDTVVFDDELSPSQLRNLERHLTIEAPGSRICDRTALILDIFDQRATTQEAKLQVQLAQLEYQLPRLTRMWTHLERQAGGMVKGMGEKQIEVDKRILRTRMAKIRGALEQVREKRNLYRARRAKNKIPVVALVGYSNAGKSTLLNKLSNAGVSAKDNLFETLDPVTRKIRLPDGHEILLTDTVGFVQRLPPQLVAAFRATLEEITYADLILHVVDVSSPMCKDQYKVTKTVLEQIGAKKVPTFTVCNKIDSMEEETDSNDRSKDSLRSRLDTDNTIGISALTGEGLSEMLERIDAALAKDMFAVEGFLPYNDAGLLQTVRSQGRLRIADYTEKGIHIEADVNEELLGLLKDKLVSAV